MVRTSAIRKRRYALKISQPNLAHISRQKREFRNSIGGQVAVEHKVKQVLEGAGASVLLNHFYMDFGKKIYSLMKQYSGATLTNEACVQWRKWSMRGLDNNILDEILCLYMPSLCDPNLDLFGLPWTGQTTSYATDDDGQLQKGKPVTRPIPTGRYTDNGNGTVTDNATGLMWARDGNGPGCNNGVKISWANALVFCGNLNFAGYSDWRLPNLFELMSIVDCEHASPCILEPPFVNTAEELYWSSTSNPAYSLWAFAVEFDETYVKDFDKDAAWYVRAVRGGVP